MEDYTMLSKNCLGALNLPANTTNLAVIEKYLKIAFMTGRDMEWWRQMDTEIEDASSMSEDGFIVREPDTDDTVFMAIGNDELTGADTIDEGSKLRNSKTGEVCIVKNSSEPKNKKHQESSAFRLQFITTKEHKDYMVGVQGQLIESDWKVIK